MTWFHVLKERIKLVQISSPSTPLKRESLRSFSYHQPFIERIKNDSVFLNRRIVRKRVYSDVYYCSSMSIEQLRKRKAIRVLFALLACALLIASIRFSLILNDNWFVIIPQAISVIIALFLLYYICISLFSGSKLTTDAYRETAIALPICALLWLLFLSASTLLLFILSLVTHKTTAAIPSVLCSLCAAICVAIIIHFELKTTYIVEKNIS